jgi:hypothetical protein
VARQEVLEDVVAADPALDEAAVDGAAGQRLPVGRLLRVGGAGLKKLSPLSNYFSQKTQRRS